MTRSEVTEDNAFEMVNFHISCFFYLNKRCRFFADSVSEGLYSVYNDCKMGLSGQQVLRVASRATSFRKAMQPQLARSARLVLPTEPSVSAYVNEIQPVSRIRNRL